MRPSGKPADFVLRRYAWLGADDEQVRTEVAAPATSTA